jgi:hypothetical protein
MKIYAAELNKHRLPLFFLHLRSATSSTALGLLVRAHSPLPSANSCLAFLSLAFQGINDVAWAATSRFLASASDDTTIRVWDITTVRAEPLWQSATPYAFTPLLTLVPHIPPSGTGQNVEGAQGPHKLRLLRQLQPPVKLDCVRLGR